MSGEKWVKSVPHRSRLEATDLAVRRTDRVNLSELRGLLVIDDGAPVFVTTDGMSMARPSDGARIVAMTFGFRTGGAHYTWLNTSFVVAEGVLDRIAVGGRIPLQLSACEPTIELKETPRRPDKRSQPGIGMCMEFRGLWS